MWKKEKLLRKNRSWEKNRMQKQNRKVENTYKKGKIK